MLALAILGQLLNPLALLFLFSVLKLTQIQGLNALKKATVLPRKAPEHLRPGIASWFMVAMAWAFTAIVAWPLR